MTCRRVYAADPGLLRRGEEQDERPDDSMLRRDEEQDERSDDSMLLPES